MASKVFPIAIGNTVGNELPTDKFAKKAPTKIENQFFLPKKYKKHIEIPVGGQKGEEFPFIVASVKLKRADKK